MFAIHMRGRGIQKSASKVIHDYILSISMWPPCIEKCFVIIRVQAVWGKHIGEHSDYLGVIVWACIEE